MCIFMKSAWEYRNCVYYCSTTLAVKNPGIELVSGNWQTQTISYEVKVQQDHVATFVHAHIIKSTYMYLLVLCVCAD